MRPSSTAFRRASELFADARYLLELLKEKILLRVRWRARLPEPPRMPYHYELRGDAVLLRRLSGDNPVQDGISVIAAVKNRSENLAHALPTWLEQPEVDEVILIDWHSDTPVLDAVPLTRDPKVRVLRVENQPYWVLTWAFNLAARAAGRTRLLKLDADIELKPGFLEHHTLRPKEMITGDYRVHGPHMTGQCYLWREDFLAAQGYNEHILTYGNDDTDLYARLQRKGIERRLFTPGWMRHRDHEDAERIGHQETGGETPWTLGKLSEQRFGKDRTWDDIHMTTVLEQKADARFHVLKRRQERHPETALGELSGTHVDLFLAPGNWGDALIAEGTRQILTGLGITFTEREVGAPLHSATRAKVAIFRGGGGLTEYYRMSYLGLRLASMFYDRVIVMPSTVAGERSAELLAELPEHVTMFCREPRSYDFVAQHWKYAPRNLFLAHDMAFLIDYQPYRAEGSGTFDVFREDAERTGISIPPNNRDFPEEGTAHSPIEPFLTTIARYERVRTNRLHVAIAAANLGKEVDLYPNSYWKNEQMYRYSLERRFPNVHWHGE